jgi:hypothetical protein
MSKEQGQQLGIDMANNFMLMTLFSIVADMSEDPEGVRTFLRKELLDLTDSYNLPGISDDREARDAAKQIINGILQARNRSTKIERSEGVYANSTGDLRANVGGMLVGSFVLAPFAERSIIHQEAPAPIGQRA